MSEDVIRQYIRDRWGTQTTATLIYDAEQLQAINDDLDGNYILMDDINLSGIDWTPIGNDTDHFTGSFNGNGHTISNLTISGTDDHVGLFGHVGAEEGPTSISNVYLTGFIIEGNRGVGTLIGRVTGNAETTVTNCYATASTAFGISGATGGLFGSFNSFQEAPGGTNNPVASNCHADVAVSASDGADKVGGMSGCGQKGTFIDCYAIGQVACDNGERVGGFAGCVEFLGLVTNCYSAGEVGTIGTGSDYGGLVGRAGTGDNAGVVTDSYWDIETSGQPTSAGGTGYTTAQMKDPANFPTWDAEVWTLESGSYPALSYPSPSLYNNLPIPAFVTDYDMLHGEMSSRDTILVLESDMERTVRGIGYHAVDTSRLYQLHLYGPDRNRGKRIRDTLESILDQRTLRMRYPGMDGILYMDSRRRMDGMKRAYGYVYDLRIQQRGEIL